MKITVKEALAAHCPHLWRETGQKSDLSTGLLRTDPSRDRRPAASDKGSMRTN